MSEIKKEMQDYDDKLNSLASEIDEMIDGREPAKHIADMCMDMTGAWNKRDVSTLTNQVSELRAALERIIKMGYDTHKTTRSRIQSQAKMALDKCDKALKDDE